MSPRQTKMNVQFTPSAIDEVTGALISPEHLPDYRGAGACIEITAAYQRLEAAQTATDFYEAIATLIFHARHLHPVEHATLANMIATPFKRKRGKPETNQKLVEDADALIARDLMFVEIKELKITAKDVANLARRHRTSKELARREIRKAKARFDKESTMLAGKGGKATT